MAIPFSPRAAFCTLVVLGGFAAAGMAQLPGGLFGLVGMDREGVLPIAGSGSPPADDQRDIVTAVLEHEGRRPGRDNGCVRLADEGGAFTEERMAIARLVRAAAAANPADRPRLAGEVERLRDPARSWSRAISGPAGPLPLGAEAASQLNAAETSLLGTPDSGRVDVMLNMSALPASLRSRAPDCNMLTFTGPALAGDIAFVETRYAPRGAAAEASLYAVVKIEDRWSVEAVAPK